MADLYPGQLPYAPMECVSTGGMHGIGGALSPFFNLQGAATWPAAQRAIFVPFRLSWQFMVRRMAWVNTNTTGTLDVGVYALDGTRLCSTGAVTRTGANVLQSAAVTAPLMLGPGTYYFASLCSSAAGTLIGLVATIATWDPRCHGLAKLDAGANTLPAVATLASYTDTVIPLVAATSRSASPP
jgi:hypothetical protein